MGGEFWSIFWITTFVGAAICGGFSAWLADTKGRDCVQWFWLGFFFGPLALLALGLSPSLKACETDKRYDDTDERSPFPLPAEKTCPRCRERIKFKALVCRHCRHEFGEEAVDQSVREYVAEKNEQIERESANRLAKKELAGIRFRERRFETDLADEKCLIRIPWGFQYYPEGYIEDLLRAGAPVNTRSMFWGASPLHFAAGSSRQDLVPLLLEYGAEVNVRDLLGRTPLDYARVSNNAEAMKVLIASGGVTGKALRAREKEQEEKAKSFVSFACKHCGKELNVPVKYAGQAGNCTHCGGRIQVPKSKRTLPGT